jgi:hypothetical protein
MAEKTAKYRTEIQQVSNHFILLYCRAREWPNICVQSATAHHSFNHAFASSPPRFFSHQSKLNMSDPLVRFDQYTCY